MCRGIFLGLTLVLGWGSAVSFSWAEDKSMPGPLDFKLTDIDGKEFDLSQLKGKVVLIVNVASECGYTPQYEGLQELYKKYEKAGLVVIGIPSNDFGRQEPGSNEEIKKFCTTRYKVTFPMMAKAVVRGEGQLPLYKVLIEATPNEKGQVQQVAWNFEKFLIGRDGRVAGRFKSAVDPESEELLKAIRRELDKPVPKN
ncbi:glutathione peroxidase [thermophilic bacterium 2918]|uniref:Glutathione peroxidase n=2 Tax=Thermogemmata fonticola TaxID=2755323 RepID=A0A7V8VCG6_9BACT|nr:glutathione peroxidase [Thermogemmata fonticola]